MHNSNAQEIFRLHFVFAFNVFPNLIKKNPNILSGELDRIEEDGASEQSPGKSAPE